MTDTEPHTPSSTGTGKGKNTCKEELSTLPSVPTVPNKWKSSGRTLAEIMSGKAPPIAEKSSPTVPEFHYDTMKLLLSRMVALTLMLHYGSPPAWVSALNSWNPVDLSFRQLKENLTSLSIRDEEFRKLAFDASQQIGLSQTHIVTSTCVIVVVHQKMLHKLVGVLKLIYPKSFEISSLKATILASPDQPYASKQLHFVVVEHESHQNEALRAAIKLWKPCCIIYCTSVPEKAISVFAKEKVSVVTQIHSASRFKSNINLGSKAKTANWQQFLCSPPRYDNIELPQNISGAIGFNFTVYAEEQTAMSKLRLNGVLYDMEAFNFANFLQSNHKRGLVLAITDASLAKEPPNPILHLLATFLASQADVVCESKHQEKLLRIIEFENLESMNLAILTFPLILAIQDLTMLVLAFPQDLIQSFFSFPKMIIKDYRVVSAQEATLFLESDNVVENDANVFLSAEKWSWDNLDKESLLVCILDAANQEYEELEAQKEPYKTAISTAYGRLLSTEIISRKISNELRTIYNISLLQDATVINLQKDVESQLGSPDSKRQARRKSGSFWQTFTPSLMMTRRSSGRFSVPPAAPKAALDVISITSAAGEAVSASSTSVLKVFEDTVLSVVETTLLQIEPAMVTVELMQKIITYKPELPFTELDLEHCSIGPPKAELLGALIFKLRNLTALYLYQNKISSEGSGLSLLCNALILNASLRKLDLGCNLIDDDGAKIFRPVLECNTTLRFIAFPFNQITDSGLEHLCVGLAVNRTLEELIIENNPITEVSFGRIRDAVGIRQSRVRLGSFMDDKVYRNMKDSIVSNLYYEAPFGVRILVSGSHKQKREVFGKLAAHANALKATWYNYLSPWSSPLPSPFAKDKVDRWVHESAGLNFNFFYLPSSSPYAALTDELLKGHYTLHMVFYDFENIANHETSTADYVEVHEPEKDRLISTLKRIHLFAPNSFVIVVVYLATNSGDRERQKQAAEHHVANLLSINAINLKMETVVITNSNIAPLWMAIETNATLKVGSYRVSTLCKEFIKVARKKEFGCVAMMSEIRALKPNLALSQLDEILDQLHGMGELWALRGNSRRLRQFIVLGPAEFCEQLSKLSLSNVLDRAGNCFVEQILPIVNATFSPRLKCFESFSTLAVFLDELEWATALGLINISSSESQIIYQPRLVIPSLIASDVLEDRSFSTFPALRSNYVLLGREFKRKFPALIDESTFSRLQVRLSRNFLNLSLTLKTAGYLSDEANKFVVARICIVNDCIRFAVWGIEKIAIDICVRLEAIIQQDSQFSAEEQHFVLSPRGIVKLNSFESDFLVKPILQASMSTVQEQLAKADDNKLFIWDHPVSQTDSETVKQLITGCPVWT